MLTSTICLGQSITNEKQLAEKKLKYEIGFNLYSMTDLRRGIYYDNANYIYNNNFFSGIFVKRHFNKNVLRLLFDYNQRLVNYKWESKPWYSKTIGDVKATEFRFGYERELGSKKIIPYISIDLCYNYSKATGFSTVYGDFVSYQDKEYLIKRNEYSICYGTGLKYRVTNNITLSYEFSLQCGYYNSHDYKSDPYNYIDNDFFYKLNPIRQMGLSIRF